MIQAQGFRYLADSVPTLDTQEKFWGFNLALSFIHKNTIKTYHLLERLGDQGLAELQETL